MAESKNTYTAFIDPRLSFAQRKQIGDDIINFIRKRSARKKGVGGQRFKSYEKSYAATPEFKAAGKSINNPNVNLHGTMLDDLKVLDASLAGRVVIGFTNGRSNDKSVWIREKGFHFLGLSAAELTFITVKYQPKGSTENDLIQQIIAVRAEEEE